MDQIEKIDTEWFKWAGTGFTLVGAIATALAFDPLNVFMFNFGALSWLIASIRMKDMSLMAVNSGLLAIYFIGFLIRVLS
jgi:preprotein translocase subunit Sss1